MMRARAGILSIMFILSNQAAVMRRTCFPRRADCTGLRSPLRGYSPYLFVRIACGLPPAATCGRRFPAMNAASQQRSSRSIFDAVVGVHDSVTSYRERPLTRKAAQRRPHVAHGGSQGNRFQNESSAGNRRPQVAPGCGHRFAAIRRIYLCGLPAGFHPQLRAAAGSRL